MRRYQQNIPANESWTINANGNYIFLRTCGVSVVVEARENSEQAELSQGDSAEFTEFSQLTITNPTGAALLVVVQISKNKAVRSSQVGGSVALSSPVNGAGANAQKTVTTTAAQLVAANATRKYLLIQNKDPVGSIWINFSGTATQANGYRLGPGDAEKFDCNLLTGAVSAIGDISSNANVVVVEA